MLLIGSFFLACSATFFYIAHIHVLSGGHAHSGLGSLLISNQENAKLMELNSSIKSSSSQFMSHEKKKSNQHRNLVGNITKNNYVTFIKVQAEAGRESVRGTSALLYKYENPRLKPWK